MPRISAGIGSSRRAGSCVASAAGPTGISLCPASSCSSRSPVDCVYRAAGTPILIGPRLGVAGSRNTLVPRPAVPAPKRDQGRRIPSAEASPGSGRAVARSTSAPPRSRSTNAATFAPSRRRPAPRRRFSSPPPHTSRLRSKAACTQRSPHASSRASASSPPRRRGGTSPARSSSSRPRLRGRSRSSPCGRSPKEVADQSDLLGRGTTPPEMEARRGLRTLAGPRSPSPACSARAPRASAVVVLRAQLLQLAQCLVEPLLHVASSSMAPSRGAYRAHLSTPCVRRTSTVHAISAIGRGGSDYPAGQNKIQSSNDGRDQWAYRFRIGGRDGKRVQRGGFASAEDAHARPGAREAAAPRQGRSNADPRRVVDEYLAQHEASPVTLEKLRFLLQRAVAAFGDYRLDELNPLEIAAWRMTIPPGYRFEATQALRQVLARAVVWGCSTSTRPSRASRTRSGGARRSARSSPGRRSRRSPNGSGRASGRWCSSPPPPGMRPGEWVALEHRDVDRDGRVAYVRRAFAKAGSSARRPRRAAAPCRSRQCALAALDQLPRAERRTLLFPAERGGYLDLHNFRNRDWKPAQIAAGIEPFRRIYDLRHTFATFALRAGISTFELSRYMGASLTMIDRHYGHLARDGREHAIRLLDDARRSRRWTLVDARWTPKQAQSRHAQTTEAAAEQEDKRKPSDGLEPSTPSLPPVPAHACTS